MCQDSNVSVYCRIYSAGGPKITIKDPSDPSELLQSANDWMSAMHDDPTANARPYQWLLSPLSIVEGPLPPNSADLEHAQDILRTCATARLTLLDQLNQLCWYRDHATHYDWSKSASPTDFARFIADVQTDLDTIASGAIDHPAQAVMPSDWAQGHGGTFPTSVPPSIFPEELKSNPVPVPVVLPHWTFGEDIEIGSGDGTIPSASSLGLNVSLDWVVGTGITGTVISMTPKPGDTVMSGSTVFISLVNNPDN